MQEIMNYQQILEDIRGRINQTSDNFVYIGWQLKNLISTGMMQQAGYSSIEELGRAEFHLNKDATYRFIKINTKYSVGGNGPELDERYKGMGQSALSEMLTLPDEDLMLITDKTKREDIRELNRFNKQEPDEEEQAAGGDLQNIITEFFRPAQGREAKERHKMMEELLDIIEGNTVSTIMSEEEEIQECINPKGNATFRSGKYFLFLYEARDGMKYKVFGSDENHHVSYMEFAKMAFLIFTIANPLKDGLDAWESFYGPEPKVEAKQELKVQKQEEIQRPVKEEFQKSQKPEVKSQVLTKQEPEKEVQKKLETQVKTGEEPGNQLLAEAVGEIHEKEELEESYPQENDENNVLAPALLGQERKQQDEEREPMFLLREDAESYLEKIKEALEENQYFIAKIETKHLLETLSEVCEIMDGKQIDGQMEIHDYIEE